MARFGQITASTLNLRRDSNTSSTILDAFTTGTIVEILDTVTGGSYSLPSGRTSNQWHKVKVELCLFKMILRVFWTSGEKCSPMLHNGRK